MERARLHLIRAAGSRQPRFLPSRLALKKCLISGIHEVFRGVHWGNHLCKPKADSNSDALSAITKRRISYY